MITVEQLKVVGFKDWSDDQNGLAYRKFLPSKVLELFYHVNEKCIRLQSIGSGFTMKIEGVNDLHDVIKFWLLMTGEKLELPEDYCWFCEGPCKHKGRSPYPEDDEE